MTRFMFILCGLLLPIAVNGTIGLISKITGLSPSTEFRGLLVIIALVSGIMLWFKNGKAHWLARFSYPPALLLMMDYWIEIILGVYEYEFDVTLLLPSIGFTFFYTLATIFLWKTKPNTQVKSEYQPIGPL